MFMTIVLGRHEVEVNDEDVVLDNGCCVQVITRYYTTGRFDKTTPRISKKLFNEFLKKNCLILFKENEYGKYYHFDTNRLFEEGYVL